MARKAKTQPVDEQKGVDASNGATSEQNENLTQPVDEQEQIGSDPVSEAEASDANSDNIYVALSRILHNGQEFKFGDEITLFSSAEIEPLIQSGAIRKKGDK